VGSAQTRQRRVYLRHRRRVGNLYRGGAEQGAMNHLGVEVADTENADGECPASPATSYFGGTPCLRRCHTAPITAPSARTAPMATNHEANVKVTPIVPYVLLSDTSVEEK
jgi:hypothetical protein